MRLGHRRDRCRRADRQSLVTGRSLSLGCVGTELAAIVNTGAEDRYNMVALAAAAVNLPSAVGGLDGNGCAGRLRSRYLPPSCLYISDSTLAQTGRHFVLPAATTSLIADGLPPSPPQRRFHTAPACGLDLRLQSSISTVLLSDVSSGAISPPDHRT